jgi:hypothetical protein
MQMLTPKQESILRYVKRYGKHSTLTAFDIGVGLDHPGNRAEKWAKPALKELVKQKLITRNSDGSFGANSSE